MTKYTVEPPETSVLVEFLGQRITIRIEVNGGIATVAITECDRNGDWVAAKDLVHWLDPDLDGEPEDAE